MMYIATYVPSDLSTTIPSPGERFEPSEPESLAVSPVKVIALPLEGVKDTSNVTPPECNRAEFKLLAWMVNLERTPATAFERPSPTATDFDESNDATDDAAIASTFVTGDPVT